MDRSNIHDESNSPLLAAQIFTYNHLLSNPLENLHNNNNTPQQLNPQLIPHSFPHITPTEYLNQEILPITQTALQNFVNTPDFDDNIQLAFGYGCNVELAHTIVDNLAHGQLIPDIQIIPQSQLKADGAFGNNTIYLSQDLFNPQHDNSQQAVNVLLEEIGHYIDSQINIIDAPGDEGKIFAYLVQNHQLTTTELTALKAENDHSTLKLKGQTFAVEHADTPGVFVVDNNGKISIDFLADSGSYHNEMAIFSLENMDNLTPGSVDYIKEAARRALSNSALGYTVIIDINEGAKFTGEFGESNKNDGNYVGVKTFNFTPGDKIAFMLVPQGTVQQVFDNPNAGNNLRPLFSIAAANPNNATQIGQLVPGTFGWEDIRNDQNTDADYNDIIFQIKGATGILTDIGGLFASGKDWRNVPLAQEIIAFASQQDNTTLTAKLSQDTGISYLDGITNNPEIAGSINNAENLSKLQAKFSDGSNFVDILSELKANGNFTLNKDKLAAIKGNQLADGEYQLTLRSEDKFGNISEFSVKFTLDTTKPGIPTEIGLKNDSDIVTNQNTPTITGKGENGALIEIFEGENKLGETTVVNGFWEITTSQITDGLKKLTITATDISGNQSDTSNTEFTIDSALPQINITNPQANAILNPGARLQGTVNGTGSTIDKLSYRFGNGSEINVPVNAQGAFDVELNLTGLSSGQQNLIIKAIDLAGNSTENTQTVVINSNITSPLTPGFMLDTKFDSAPIGDSYTTFAKVNLIGQTEANATVTLQGIGTSITADNAGKFTFTDVPLILGDNSFTVNAQDIAGNTSIFTTIIKRVEQDNSDVVLDWNAILLNAIYEDKTTPPVASRNMAITQTAVFDAINSITGTYENYHFTGTAPTIVSAEAAAASAAHQVLINLYPGQKSYFDNALTASLAEITDGTAEDNGVIFGRTVADDILALRSADGASNTVTYTPGNNPGQWQPNAPGFASALLPQWGQVTPFALTSGNQFRPDGTPALNSADYTTEFNQVKDLGSKNSTTRTAEQTQIAKFWADGSGTFTPPGHWNQIAQNVAAEKGNSLVENARLFALLDISLADAGIAAWDAKYTYDFWRPITAIQNADSDGNADTIADANWTPLLNTPPFPEYVSGHSTFSGAADVILTELLGSNVSFTTNSLGIPGVYREFDNFTDAANEAGISRIYGGIHFNSANVEGLATGRSVGNYVLDNLLLPLVNIPIVSIIATDPSSREPINTTDTGTFTISREGGNLSEDLTINYSISGTAENGIDYTNISDSVTILAGESTAIVSIDPIADDLVEISETVTLSLIDTENYDLDVDADIATVTIFDDITPIVSIEATDSSATEPLNTTDTGKFIISRNGVNLDEDLTVNYIISGTATNGVDYTFLSSNITIAAGQNLAEIIIDPIDDQITEGSENVTLTLVDGINYDVSATANSDTATIIDAEEPPAIVSIEATDSTATEPLNTDDIGKFTVTRNGGNLDQPLTISYTINGTAENGIDYNTLSGIVTINAGKNSAEIIVNPIDDMITEGNENVILTLNDGDNYDLGSNIASVTIIDAEENNSGGQADIDVVLVGPSTISVGQITTMQVTFTDPNQEARGILIKGFSGLNSGARIVAIPQGSFGGGTFEFSVRNVGFFNSGVDDTRLFQAELLDRENIFSRIITSTEFDNDQGDEVTLNLIGRPGINIGPVSAVPFDPVGYWLSGNGDPNQNARNESNECQDCKATVKGTSEVELHSGAVIETHELSTYQSLGQERRFTLTYDSVRADSRPILHFDYNNIIADPNLRLVAELTVSQGDTQIQVPGFAGGQYGFDGGEHFWTIPNTGGKIDAALQADLRSFASGLYNYELSSGIYYFDGNTFNGARNINQGTFLHVNSIGSAFGNGWGLAGLQELIENEDDSVLLIDGDGSELLFTKSTNQNTYNAPPGDFSTLEKLQDGTFRRTLKDRTVYTFNAANKLNIIEDRNGNQTQFIYNESEQLIGIIDPVGLETTFNYTNGKVTSITDPAGRTTQLEYDANGNLLSITDPDNSQRTWEYDADYHITAEIDKNGNREQMFYDFAGRADRAITKDGKELDFDPVQTQGLYQSNATINPINAPVAFQLGAVESTYIDANGNAITYTLDQAGQAVSVTDAIGKLPTLERNHDNLITVFTDARDNITRFTYDQNGNVLSVRDFLNIPKLFSYDPVFNQITSIRDELGNQTVFEIDSSNGNILSKMEVIGDFGGGDDIVTQFTYTSQGLVDLITDPLGRITDYDYDNFGNLKVITVAKGTTEQAIRQFEYDLAGNQTAIIDENSNRTTFEYDALNRLVKIIEADPDGNGPLTSPITTYSYDADGNLILTTDAVGNVNQNTYDELNRLIENIDELNQKTNYSYDGLGNLLSVVDPLGNETENKYDARNRIIETIDPDNGITKFTYDLSNNLTSVTDPVNNQTTFVYDARNRLISETDPLEKVTQYEYDSVNNLIVKIDRNDRRIEYNYDDINRLTQETWIGTDQVINYSYDKASNQTLVNDKFSSLAFTYDNRDRLLSVNNAGTPGFANVNLNYTYDKLGNVISVVDNINNIAGGNNSYTYDALNRLTQLTQSGNNISDKRIDFAYNSLGQYTSINRYANLTGTQLVNGTSYTYDSLNRLTNLNHSNGTNNVAFYNYVYDAASRITEITDIDGTTDYTYDKRAQLTGANHSDANNPDESYTYDDNGNRITSSIHGNGYVTGKGNRLLSDGKYNYEYDNEGNLTKQTEIATGNVQELTWDYRNRLVAMVDQDAEGNETQRVELTYDAFNRRIAKSVDTNPQDTTPAVVTQFIYDGQDVLLEFVDSDGAGGNQPVLDTRYLHGAGVDQVMAQESAGNVEWHLTDHLGTVRDLVNNSGAVVNHFVYDSFGQVISESNPAIDTRYLFTGREFDQEIGLYYYRARYYDQTTGRFLSEDPIGFDGGDSNLYRYVFNNPVLFFDPSGEFTINISFYEGYGGGLSFSYDPFTQCAQFSIEFGVGIGGGIEFDPFSQVKRNDPSKFNTFAEISGNYGIGGAKAGVETGVKLSPDGNSPYTNVKLEAQYKDPRYGTVSGGYSIDENGKSTPSLSYKYKYSNGFPSYKDGKAGASGKAGFKYTSSPFRI